MVKATTPVTIKDIARQLNLSVSTVSYALNGGPRRVSTEVRDRVLVAARELSYRPNQIARAMVTRRTHTIGIVPHHMQRDLIVAPYNQMCISTILNESETIGYDVLLYTRFDLSETERVVDGILNGRVDGVLFLAASDASETVKKVLHSGIPSVLLSSHSSLPVPQFTIDNRKATRSVMAHLMSLGHHRIAHVAGVQTQEESICRKETYVDCMNEAGLPHVYRDCQYDPNLAVKYAVQLMASKAPPTALFVANDDMALAIMAEFRRMGISVPGAVSIVGFDDAPQSSDSTPSLTTVRQPVDKMAMAGLHALIAQIEGQPVPSSKEFPAELVVRASTACPKEDTLTHDS